MKREIRFRAWDTVNNQMNPPEEIIALTGNMTQELKESNSCLIMLQYTGLKDNNEIEIYEKDILDISGIGVCIIEWYKETLGYVVTSFENGDYYDYQDMIEETITKLGNIYENPELIKQ